MVRSPDNVRETLPPVAEGNGWVNWSGLATLLAAAGTLRPPLDRLLDRLLRPSELGWASQAAGSTEAMNEEHGNQKE
jgi:hypothetical protein